MCVCASEHFAHMMSHSVLADQGGDVPALDWPIDLWLKLVLEQFRKKLYLQFLLIFSSDDNKMCTSVEIYTVYIYISFFISVDYGWMDGYTHTFFFSEAVI